MGLQNYKSPGCFDEVMTEGGTIRPPARTLVGFMAGLQSAQLRQMQQLADAAILRMGVTFTVYRCQHHPQITPPITPKLHHPMLRTFTLQPG